MQFAARSLLVRGLDSGKGGIIDAERQIWNSAISPLHDDDVRIFAVKIVLVSLLVRFLNMSGEEFSIKQRRRVPILLYFFSGGVKLLRAGRQLKCEALIFILCVCDEFGNANCGQKTARNARRKPLTYFCDDR